MHHLPPPSAAPAGPADPPLHPNLAYPGCLVALSQGSCGSTQLLSSNQHLPASTRLLMVPLLIAVVPAVSGPCLWWENEGAQNHGGPVHGRALALDVALLDPLGASPDTRILGLALTQ